MIPIEAARNHSRTKTHLISDVGCNLYSLDIVYRIHQPLHCQMFISCGIAAKTKVVCQDVICAATKPHKQPSISPSIQSRLDTPGSPTEKLRTVKSGL